MKYFCLLLIPFLFSCQSFSSRKDMSAYVVPTVAILEFENKAQFSYRWNLGDGMRDLLVDELLQSGQFNVVTRSDLDAVIGEIDLYRTPYFRDQKKAELGNLKNVQYLIKGSVTDFAHVSSSGIRAFFSSLGLWGSSQTAIVTVSLYVIDVETGEVVASRSLEGRVHAGGVDVKGLYKGMGFGGNSFYRTPLGRATKDVMRQATESLGEAISRRPWYPGIMKIDGEDIYLSGGEDRKMKKGNIFEMRRPAEKLISPESGDVVAELPGAVIGQLQIVKVFEKYSIAEKIEGVIVDGSILRPKLKGSDR